MYIYMHPWYLVFNFVLNTYHTACKINEEDARVLYNII